jgi:hypothetical protein
MDNDLARLAAQDRPARTPAAASVDADFVALGEKFLDYRQFIVYSCIERIH